MSQEKVNDGFQAKVLKDRLDLRASPEILADKYASVVYAFEGGEDWQVVSVLANNAWVVPEGGIYEVFVYPDNMSSVFLDGNSAILGLSEGVQCWMPAMGYLGTDAAAVTYYIISRASRGWLMTAPDQITEQTGTFAFKVRFRRVG